MRTLILILAVSLSMIASCQSVKEKGYFYCIQVLSTENPELLKPPYFNDAYGEAMVEQKIINGRKYYRILFIFLNLEAQEKAFHKWREQYKDAIRVTRTEAQIQQMYPLFITD